jgi:hypothetical protein
MTLLVLRNLAMSLAAGTVLSGCGLPADGNDSEQVGTIASALTGQVYSCPWAPSDQCDDTSRCQSTCVYDFSLSSTCIFYTHGGVANVQACTPTTLPSRSGAQVTATHPSQSCSSAWRCQSSCLGQLSEGASDCEYVTSGGIFGGGGHFIVGTNVSGPTHLYSCPAHSSQGCSDMSRCESTCVGQITPQASCTWYSSNAVPNHVACQDLGIVTL